MKGLFGVWLLCFTVFTLILGAGLKFYEAQEQVSATFDDAQEPIFVAVQQGGAALITLLFTFSAIIFLMGVVRWVGKQQ